LFGLNSLQDLPNRETIEHEGFASSAAIERSNVNEVFGIRVEEADAETFEEAEF
jgi:hypothetical protein